MLGTKLKYHVFIPLYNMAVSEDILNTNIFGSYTIIKAEELIPKYGKYLTSQDTFTKNLLLDTCLNMQEKPLFRPFAMHVLCTEFEIEDKRDAFRDKMLESRQQVCNIILALRLANNGYCQINTGYYLSNEHVVGTQYKISSQYSNIEPAHVSVGYQWLLEDFYELDFDILTEATKIYDILLTYPKNKFFVPIMYFNKYYDSLTPHERIIQLATVLESTILSGRTEELNYRLCLRTSALLGKDVSDLLKLFYSIRSHIVHNGCIGKNKGYKDILKRLKKYVNIPRDEETELLFYFVKDHIEPLIRELLLKSFKLFNSGKIKDYDTLTKELESFIIQQITKDNFEVEYVK